MFLTNTSTSLMMNISTSISF